MKYLLIPFILVGCSSAPIATVTQKVSVPVAVACKTETPVKPTYCFSSLTVQDDIFTKVRCVMSDRILANAYEDSLAVALESCK